MHRLLAAGAFALAGFVSVNTAGAAIIYDDRSAFLGALGTSITDDYSAPGYAVGDIGTVSFGAYHSNDHMSAVLGETRYVSTGFGPNQINFVGQIAPNNTQGYCAGCNGSFLLEFTATSVGSAAGVFGVGLDFDNLGDNDTPYFAFVTFGDGTTANYALPVTPHATFAFFGLTSDQLIRSIHFGLENGGSTFLGSFSIDNLTIGAAGSAPVPEPGMFALLALGFGAIVVRTRRRRSR